MTTGRSRRWLGALGSLIVAAALAGTAQPAAADSTRTINGTTTCSSGIVPFGFSVNLGAGWVQADSSYQIPGTQTKVWTKVIPSGTTSIALDTLCYNTWNEYYGLVPFVYGTWNGWTYSLTPGTSTVDTTWVCSRHPIYPGPWVRTCSRTAISY